MRWTSRRHRPAVLPRHASAPTPPTTPPEPELPATPVVTLLHREPAPVGCRVVVVGSSWGLVALAQHVPASWSVEYVDEVGDLTVADLVVLTSPTPGKIAAVAARQPDAGILALAHPAAEVDAVVALLQHGATACVRTTDVALVAAHLLACARRYALGAG